MIQRYGDSRSVRAEDGGFDELRAVTTAFSAGRYIILGCLLVLGAITAVVVWMIPGRYEADATVLVQPVGDFAGPDSATVPIPPDMVRSQLEVVRSPQVVTRVIDKLGMMDDPEFAPPGALRGRDTEARRAIVLGNVEKRLTVDNDGRSVTIHIGFEARSPQRARRVADEIATEYIRSANDLKNRALALSASRLEQRLADLRHDAVHAENAAENFRRSAGLVQLAAPADEDDRLGGSTYASRLLEQFSRQAAEIAATAEQAEARARIAAGDMRRTGGANTPEILSSPVVAGFVQRDAELATTEASLAARYTKDYPPLVQLRVQRAKLHDALVAARSSIKRSLDNQASTAVVADRAAVVHARSLEQLVSRQATAAVRYRQLRREAATKRKIYEDLADRAGTISQRALLQLPDAVLVSPALLPIKESWPNRPVLFAVGCVASLAIGCVLALVVQARRVRRRA